MLFAQRQAIGRVVLAAYGIGFAGVLLIGQRLMLVSIAAFLVMVLWRLANAPRRSRRSTPVGRVGWAPFRAGPWLFLVVPAVLGLPFLIDVLARHDGFPDIGNTGLLMPRAHYRFVSHAGVYTDVEPWRFLTFALLFHALWAGVGAFVAWTVFFKEPRFGR